MKMIAALILILMTGCVARYELRPADDLARDAVALDAYGRPLQPPPPPPSPPTVSRNSTTINVR